MVKTVFKDEMFPFNITFHDKSLFLKSSENKTTVFLWSDRDLVKNTVYKPVDYLK